MKRKIKILKDAPEQSRLAALEWAKSGKTEVTTGCPYFLAVLNNGIYAGWLQKKGKDVSHIIPLECQIDPKDVDCQSFDKKEKLIDLDEFEGSANSEIFNQLLHVAVMLTKDRCDECIIVTENGRIIWENNSEISIESRFTASPDEAELFAYRLLEAVKRARENRDE